MTRIFSPINQHWPFSCPTLQPCSHHCWYLYRSHWRNTINVLVILMDVIISYIRERLHTEAAHPLAEGHHVANSAISWPPLQLSQEWWDIARFLLREVDVNCVTLIQSIQKLRFVSHSQPIQRSPPLLFLKEQLTQKCKFNHCLLRPPPPPPPHPYLEWRAYYPQKLYL